MEEAVLAIIGLGANLPAADGSSPLATCQRAAASLEPRVGTVRKRSSWYLSAPLPPSAQPWYVNGAVLVETRLAPGALLEALHAIERAYGRVRRARCEARVLDLDLLAYDDQLIDAACGLRVPHPRLAERAFALLPLLDVAPWWRHPAHGRTAREMLSALPAAQAVRRLA
jgi:2-amino-4-hydroxy-6-hydroxymethyldihydropteridine diphosphokinase